MESEKIDPFEGGHEESVKFSLVIDILLLKLLYECEIRKDLFLFGIGNQYYTNYWKESVQSRLFLNKSFVKYYVLFH